MKKNSINILIICLVILIVFSIMGCGKSNTIENVDTFDENKAISMVIKDNSDFPPNQNDTFIKKIPIGGPLGAAANVKFTTKVEKSEGTSYIVTLTKDWGISVNGKYVRSSWKYRVTPDGISSIESIDNDDLINIIK